MTANTCTDSSIRFTIEERERERERLEGSETERKREQLQVRFSPSQCTSDWSTHCSWYSACVLSLHSLSHHSIHYINSSRIHQEHPHTQTHKGPLDSSSSDSSPFIIQLTTFSSTFHLPSLGPEVQILSIYTKKVQVRE